jgi:hypothetical protein
MMTPQEAEHVHQLENEISRLRDERRRLEERVGLAERSAREGWALLRSLRGVITTRPLDARLPED